MEPALFPLKVMEVAWQVEYGDGVEQTQARSGKVRVRWRLEPYGRSVGAKELRGRGSPTLHLYLSLALTNSERLLLTRTFPVRA